MSKLTLSVDSKVVVRAKRYAKAKGLSISSMVEAYLAAVAGPEITNEDTPVLRSLRGSLRAVGIEDYREHLIQKFK